MSIDQVRTSQFEDFVKLVKNMTDSIQNYESTAASKLYFEEENKFQNWFDGYSFEENPLIEKRFNNKKIGNMEYSGVEQKVTSCATSGVIKTPKFGEPFDTSVFINGNPNFPNQPYLFSINLDIEKMQFVENKSIDLTLNIETDMDKNKKELLFLCGNLLAPVNQNISLSLQKAFNIKTGYKLRPWPGSQWWKGKCSKEDSIIDLTLVRFPFSRKEINARKTMTGMKLSWRFKQNRIVNSEPCFLDGNKNFRDFVNLTSQFDDQEPIWKIIKEVKRGVVLSN